MKKGNYLKRAGALMMAVAISATMAMPVFAADSTSKANNSATKNDLTNSDIIDMSKTGSLAIYKYDITAAEAAGDYEAGTFKATGEADSRVEDALKDYGVEGVQFTYLKVGNIETHSVNNGDGSFVEVVYEIPTDLAGILNLSKNDAVDMSTKNEANPCTKSGVYHYTSDQIDNALKAILDSDNIGAKNKLEGYLYNYGTMDSTTDQQLKKDAKSMPKTDENGYTYVEELPLGLYLVVETEVPENVTDTVNPWFISLPFTNTSAQTMNEDGTYSSSADHEDDGVTNSDDVDGTDANEDGGEQWLYNATCYPKNQTGNPTLDKSVRNAYSNTVSLVESDETHSTFDKNGTVNNNGENYDKSNTSESLVVYNKDTNAENKADANDDAYVANRGGYTSDGVTAGAGGAGYSTDYAYNDTTTASEGDLLDYILVSKLPTITSTATYLSEYTFTDTLSKGLEYNHDAKIAFYDNKADADANNTINAKEIWLIDDKDDTNGLEGGHDQAYADIEVVDKWDGSSYKTGATRMIITMKEEGLKEINENYSGYYMVVYYTAYVNSNADVVLGDEGNPNDVNLVWSRTSDNHYDMLEDRNYVYSYAIDLTKEFSDDKGKFENVQFKLYNSTDAYYVIAEKTEDGVYHVTGKTTDEAQGTTFIPNKDTGRFVINGVEADKYQMTEVATDDGYNLLKDQIVIDINATDRDVIASVAGVTGMDADAKDAIVANYAGGIYDENGNLVSSQLDEILGGASFSGIVDETANGNEIGETVMYVGEIKPASATVDKIAANMTEGNQAVLLTVTNTKGFRFPQTGGNGLYIVTILGILIVAGGCYIICRKKKNAPKSR